MTQWKEVVGRVYTTTTTRTAATTTTTRRSVSHCGLAICIKKYLKAKEELWKNSNISPCKSMIFKKSSKRNQNPSRYYNSIITKLISSFNTSLAKYHFSKILI